MKKIVLLVAIFQILMLQNTSAQFYVKSNIGVRASMQYLTIDNTPVETNGMVYTSKLEKDVMAGISLGRQINKHLGLELDLLYIKGGTTSLNSENINGNGVFTERTNSVLSFMRLVYYPLGMKNRFVPYISSGGGFRIHSRLNQNDERHYQYGTINRIESYSIYKIIPTLKLISSIGVSYRLNKSFSVYAETSAIYLNSVNMKTGVTKSYKENGIETSTMKKCTSCDFKNYTYNCDDATAKKLRNYDPDSGIGLSIGLRFNF